MANSPYSEKLFIEPSVPLVSNYQLQQQDLKLHYFPLSSQTSGKPLPSLFLSLVGDFITNNQEGLKKTKLPSSKAKLLVNWESFHLFSRIVTIKIWRTGVCGIWNLICSGLIKSTRQCAHVFLGLAPPPCANTAFQSNLFYYSSTRKNSFTYIHLPLPGLDVNYNIFQH